jgi:hypothetical protein
LARGQIRPGERAARLWPAGPRPDHSLEKLDRRGWIAEIRQRLGQAHGRAPVARIGREDFLIEPTGGRKVSLPAGFAGSRDGLRRGARSRRGCRRAVRTGGEKAREHQVKDTQGISGAR